MGHKDPHRPAAPHGVAGAGHHGSHPGGDHAAPFLGDGELLNNAHPGDADVNWDALWIDVGGEG
jgi:hypothetical protein